MFRYQYILESNIVSFAAVLIFKNKNEEIKNKRMESFLLSCFVSARACMYAYVPTDDTCKVHKNRCHVHLVNEQCYMEMLLPSVKQKH